MEGFTPSIESVTEGLMEAGFINTGYSVMLLEDRVLVTVSEGFAMVVRLRSDHYEIVDFHSIELLWDAIRRAWSHD